VSSGDPRGWWVRGLTGEARSTHPETVAMTSERPRRRTPGRTTALVIGVLSLVLHAAAAAVPPAALHVSGVWDGGDYDSLIQPLVIALEATPAEVDPAVAPSHARHGYRRRAGADGARRSGHPPPATPRAPARLTPGPTSGAGAGPVRGGQPIPPPRVPSDPVAKHRSSDSSRPSCSCAYPSAHGRCG
jgi:hypothetical protein